MMDNMTSRLPESLALVLGACVILSSPAFAQGPKITLRTIMQELGAEFLQLSNSLMIDDFNGMDEAAKAIQGHPLPGWIATAIKNKLGKDFSSFESVDEQSHQARLSSSIERPREMHWALPRLSDISQKAA